MKFNELLNRAAKVVFVYYKGLTFPLVTTDLTLTAEQTIEFCTMENQERIQGNKAAHRSHRLPVPQTACR